MFLILNKEACGIAFWAILRCVIDEHIWVWTRHLVDKSLDEKHSDGNVCGVLLHTCCQT